MFPQFIATLVLVATIRPVGSGEINFADHRVGTLRAACHMVKGNFLACFLKKDMTREQVLKILGEPGASFGSIGWADCFDYGIWAEYTRESFKLKKLEFTPWSDLLAHPWWIGCCR